MKQEYKTRDLAEATALITTGNNLLRIDRHSSICFFIFDNATQCQVISNKYFFGELNVNARNYYESMVRLKNRIFQ
jgi:hypothetical protein